MCRCASSALNPRRRKTRTRWSAEDIEAWVSANVKIPRCLGGDELRDGSAAQGGRGRPSPHTARRKLQVPGFSKARRGVGERNVAAIRSRLRVPLDPEHSEPTSPCDYSWLPVAATAARKLQLDARRPKARTIFVGAPKHKGRHRPARPRDTAVV